MSDTPDLASTLEAQLESLGKQLEGTVEEFAASEAEKREELQIQIKALEEAVTKVAETLEEERRSHLPGVENATPESGKEGFSMARACRALARRDFADAPYEKEVFDNMSQKAMSQGSDSAGGYIVPEEAITSIIEALKARVIAYDLGAMDLAATGIPLVIPRLTTSATAVWVSENATITPSDLAFDQLSMDPKTVAGRVILSNLLLETSTPTADAVISEDLASQLGLAVDAAVLIGGGSGEPDGIMASAIPNEEVTASTTVAPPYADIVAFWDKLTQNNALRGSLGWALHPVAWSMIRQMTIDGGEPHIPFSVGNIYDGERDTLMGYPYAISTQMGAPTATGTDSFKQSILFGNWADCIIARWGGLRLLASDTSDDAFAKDQTHIRATMRMDVGLRHLKSFVMSTTA